ncbi:MAG: cytochrome ubiquinol oxidase subunit I [Ignavibacteriales bacterium]|nr:MAG: cytochrome ubiquinol oxidase subunit I [Ignavibacteriaceae bacterium]MBW7873274.1 cytochrome ubiquinol oxidase subunit I [Ignavibacteria bacterium]MCZ2143012.1 cytochrome ubiquinol oxidase subunit I [Ignavibacteriales bacterium]OQY79171.1 MAG: cytochrome ubiquinol oxidase subunit I [Ignavibacteriales bacterium UTCHB3]MBV6444702.1 Cytochrome bd-II ubiquinol oxidase subunit 1 [Ignavibacteriaceae bacterium]
MTTELWARLQFAFTVSFHYIFPPLSIGLGLILVIMEGLFIKTGKKMYEVMTKFWVKIFALTFAMGVATGIVMEFEFGTNWAVYSRFVGDIFGSALAAEGIFAFFLESGFLAILLFGWNKVSPRMHFFSTIMVSFGSMLSAVWIVVANSWQQTPAGYHLVTSDGVTRAEITDFREMVFNPSSVERISHVLGGAFLAGAFLVISVSAYYLVKNRHKEIAGSGLKIGLVMALFASLFQLFTGHSSATGVAENQPTKLAAMEAVYDSSAAADLYAFGWVDEENKTVHGLPIPGLLSFLVHGDSKAPIKGLDAFPKDVHPPVQLTFQTYHLMVAIGFALIAIALVSLFLFRGGRVYNAKGWLKLLVVAVLLPQISNQVGWYTAEIGRQPWIVYGMLKTSEAFSKTVTSGHIVFSLVLFAIIYASLFLVFIYLLDKKIKNGPEDETPPADVYSEQRLTV